MNLYDFGKITILPNGDVYANLNHPSLGNIHVNNIQEILHKEVEEGKSWFRVRNQAPARIVFINGFARLHPIMR